MTTQANDESKPKKSNLQEKSCDVRSELAREKKMFYFAASVCQDCQLTEGYLQSLVTVDSNIVPVVHLSVIPKE